MQQHSTPERFFLDESPTSSTTDLDWMAFESNIPPTSSPSWFAFQDDAVAPNNRLTPSSISTEQDAYQGIEHVMNDFIQQTFQVDENTKNLNNLTSNVKETVQTSHRSSSSRSHCYHKLPDHAVRLMQEWYNANLDHPYPRSPDKKRFITEGNITAQQCRSWFANRRQRLKHVKRNNQSKPLSTQTSRSVPNRFPEGISIDESTKSYEYCVFCQQQQSSSLVPPIIASPTTPTTPPTPTTPMTPTTTTINVVIDQQTIEQLIQESLRKLLYPAFVG